MPIYEFVNPITEEVIEDLFNVDEVPDSIEEDGIEFIRRKTCNTSFRLKGGKTAGWDSEGRL